MEFISNALISLKLDYPDLVPACGGMGFFFRQGVILPSVPTATAVALEKALNFYPIPACKKGGSWYSPTFFFN